VVLDTSLVSAQPLPGSTPFNPQDRLLEMRVTVTYLTPGPPAAPLFAESFQLDETPQDLGFAHVPTEEERDDAGPESKVFDCGEAELKDLCNIGGTAGSNKLVLDGDDEGAPGGATTEDYLNSVEPNRSESFWLIGHVSEHAKPTHLVLVLDGQPLSSLPKGS
jgi:hypothetical protein